MLTIYKYSLNVNDEDVAEVEMPQYARILTIQSQFDVPCVWAVVDTEHEMVTRRFRVFATGQPMQRDYTDYIGTFQLMGGNLIFHLFEDKAIPVPIVLEESLRSEREQVDNLLRIEKPTD